jgi:hypothetical protein
MKKTIMLFIFGFTILFTSANNPNKFTNPLSHKLKGINKINNYGMAEILKGANYQVLKGKDGDAAKKEISNLADKIKHFIVDNKIDMPSDFFESPDYEVVFFALLNTALYYPNQNELNSKPDPMTCLISTIGTATGLGTLIRDFTQGITAVGGAAATEAAIWTTVKRIFSAYFSWFLAIEATITFGDCMGWW